jgi:hypothetical protein
MQRKLLGFAQDMVTFEGDPMKLISQGQMASLIGRRLLKEDPAFAEGADNNFECAFGGLARANAA